MKTTITRVFSLLAVPIFGVLVSAVGCSTTDVPEQVAIDESTVTQESALVQEEATAEESLALTATPKCYKKRNCSGNILSRGSSRKECFRDIGGRSWRATKSSKCINEK